MYYCILVILLAMSACGKTLDKQVRSQVSKVGQASLGKNQVTVKNIRQVKDSAVAEIEISTAVKMKRNKEKWVIEEIRIADRRWEKVDHILAVLKHQRIATTQKQINQISSGIKIYKKQKGTLPKAQTFKELIDMLSPSYLKSVIRIDAWSNPFFYLPIGTDEYDLRSAGPDGLLQTTDDMTIKAP